MKKPARVLLIGWDAADWQLLRPALEAGEMPALAGLMARGVHGNLATLQPMVSPMLWTSIATGLTADRHGVLGFVEPDPVHGGARPWSSLTRKCRALWNMMHLSGRRSCVIGWWASHPAEPVRGITAANTFANTVRRPDGSPEVPPGAVHPPGLADRLGPMRFFPDEIGPEHVLPFVPRAAEIDQAADPRLEMLARVLSDCVTVQGLATTALEAELWDFAAVYFDGLDHFGHGFMALHPPRRPHIPERDFALYSGVMRGACRFHDMLLERLLDLAGPETAVVLCSDHGFQSGAARPLADPADPSGPTLWHRDMGILVMAGPGIRQGAEVHGASLLDLAPTVLALAGLPAGADMPGRVLAEAFEGLPVPERIPSWETVPGDDGRHPPGTPWPRPAVDLLTDQCIALGYMEDLRDRPEEAAAAAAAEADYNLAQVFLGTARPDEAIPLLEKLVAARPWETRFIHQLANALTRAGWHRAALDLLLRAYPESDAALPPPVVLLIMARAWNGLGEARAARFVAEKAAAAMPSLPGPWVDLGQLRREDRDLEASDEAFRRALALDPGFAAAWEGLAENALRRREDETAVAHAMEALRHIRQMAGAHMIAGIAAARLGRHAEARARFREAAAMRPRQPHPWRWLAALPDEADPLTREACRARARTLTRARLATRQEARDRATAVRPLPDLPAPAARAARVAAARPDPQAAEPPPGRQLVMVSGLPRSGTSLVMQMLAAGGLPAMTDGTRAADPDNPEGYLEWEPVKRLRREPSVLDDPALDTRAVKIVSPLLPAVPQRHGGRVLFVRRPVAEVVASQARMLERSGLTPPDPAALAARLEAHLGEVERWLKTRGARWSVLFLDYHELVREPALQAARMAEFLAPEFRLDPAAMAAAVRPDLHRNRS